MLSSCETYQEWIASYALGILEPEQAKAFEAHLESGCQACQQVLAETEAVVSLLPYSVKIVEPSPDLKQWLVARLFQEKPEQEPERSSAFPGVYLAAREKGQKKWGKQIVQWICGEKGSPWAPALTFAGAALVLVSILLWRQWSLEHQLNQLARQVAEANHQVQVQEKVLNLIQSSNARFVLLSSPDQNIPAYGNLIWNQETQTAYLSIFGLPKAPQGWDYQIWAIQKDGKPVSLGLLASTHQEKVELRLPQLLVHAMPSAVTITLEPKGGRAMPTGDRYLFGEM